MKILITGATGLIGKKLCVRLNELGHELFIISRRSENNLHSPHHLIRGDLTQNEIPSLRLHHFDAVFHLMGESVAQRWTVEKKKMIRNSRVNSTKNLLYSIGGVKNFIQASAVGYYGDQGSEILFESHNKGNDFLADICQEWENSGQQVLSHFPAARWVAMRLGIVLSNEGGALKKMISPFSLGLGSSLGSGHQYMSWIHIDDLISAFIHTLNNTHLAGPINATGPQPVTNLVFSEALAEVLKRPLFISTPAIALKIALGEMSQLLLDSQRASADKLIQSGFVFRYHSLVSALENLLLQSSLGK